MKKIKTKAGWIAYEATATETTLLGGMGVCDECNNAALSGYLVPVLNHYQCKDCFDDWCKRAKYYPEDAPIERRNAAYYEHIIDIKTLSEDMLS